MTVNLNLPEVEPRERRLGSLISFHGTASECYEKSLNKGLRMQDRSFSQSGSCPSTHSMNTSLIRGAAIIMHSPVGCASDLISRNNMIAVYSAANQQPLYNVPAICSNLNEHDTVYGGADKLRQAVREAYRRFSPKVIFIHTSCVSGIIGEDIESIVDEMEEELGIIISPVYCEGFRSKIWSTGFDTTAHAAIRKIVKPPSQEVEVNNIVNINNFQGTHTFDGLLGKLGLVPRYFFPFSTVEEVEHMSEALATAHICQTLGTYTGTAMEQEYGVPEIQAPAPYGLEWTDQWIREVARVTGREHLVEQVIREEHERIAPQLAELRSVLSGKVVYVLGGDSYLHSMVSCCHSFGMTLAGSIAYHRDQIYDNESEELNSLGTMLHSIGEVEKYTVCNKQPYEMIKLLKEEVLDVVVLRHQQIAITANKLGIPTFMVSDPNRIVGYDGLIYFGQSVAEAILSRRLVKNIARHARFPYTQWWMNQSDPFYYERGEAAAN
ncbi:MAG: nitrogenase [Peptococcaceae bacterium]|jgi:nitrogenase molybdenum-iron protein alpha chain|nr:nitrogenase [Peptococcaceae bacterium]